MKITEINKHIFSVVHTDCQHEVTANEKPIIQVNFMVELDWLLMTYEAGRVDKQPLVILYGTESPELSSPSLPANIRAIRQPTLS